MPIYQQIQELKGKQMRSVWPAQQRATRACAGRREATLSEPEVDTQEHANDSCLIGLIQELIACEPLSGLPAKEAERARKGEGK